MRLEKLDQDGNSYVLVVNQSILNQLGIDDETLLEMHTDGVSLIFTPVTPERRREIIREVTQKVIKRHGDALRRMANGERPVPKE